MANQPDRRSQLRIGPSDRDRAVIDDRIRGNQATAVRTECMGNADLRELAAIRSVSFGDLGESVVAVDAHNWLYRYLTTTVKWTSDEVYTTEDGTEVANLVGVAQGLPKFFEHDLTPVFVFDGAVTDLKEDEVERRREQREQYEADLADARERGDEVAVARLESRTQRLTETIVETTRELLALLDVPVVDAPAEGEAQCAHMARQGIVDYAGTEDYDALLFGAPLTLRQLTSKGDPELMEFEATLDRHDLSWEQLIDAAILCGTDFNEGVRGIGPKTAVSLLHEHGDLWGVLDARDEHIEHADRLRNLFLDPPVTDVSIDADVQPDVEAAHRYVVDTWGVDETEVSRGFERIEESMVQTGLEDWT
jgi:flap endonuclease-1